MDHPSSNQFLQYHELTERFSLEYTPDFSERYRHRHASFIPDLRDHKVYKWVASNKSFSDALLSLNRVCGKNKIDTDERDIDLAGIISFAFGHYLKLLSNPNEIISLNEEERKHGIATINELISFLRPGLRAVDLPNKDHFIKQLVSLKRDVESKPSFLPTSKRGIPENRFLVFMLANKLNEYGMYTNAAIHHILSIHPVNIESRQVERYIRSYKNYKAEIDHYNENIPEANKIRLEMEILRMKLFDSRDEQQASFIRNRMEALKDKL